MEFIIKYGQQLFKFYRYVTLISLTRDSVYVIIRAMNISYNFNTIIEQFDIQGDREDVFVNIIILCH